MPSLGFLLTRSPFSEPHFDTFLRLASAALDQGVSVRAFIDLDASLAASPGRGRTPSPRERLDALRRRGLDVVVCRACLEDRGLSTDLPQAPLADLGPLLDGVDRLVTL